MFTDADRTLLAGALDALVPWAGELGAEHYVENLLTAFDHDPPHIWAGGPFSGRHGGDPAFEQWLELGPWEAHAWRRRIDGWREVYERVLVTLRAGGDVADLDPADRRVLYEHACEACYGDPVYGGNRDGEGWQRIGFAGDVLPRGWTDTEVRGP